jgi:hypothetical protein
MHEMVYVRNAVILLRIQKYCFTPWVRVVLTGLKSLLPLQPVAGCNGYKRTHPADKVRAYVP